MAKMYMGNVWDEKPESVFNEDVEQIEAPASDRFDFEQAFLGCWNVTTDLEVVYENILGDADLSKNDIADLVLGLSKLYELKFQRTMDYFESMVRAGEFD